MEKLHILTPVKDSIETALRTIKSVMESDIQVEFTYTVYNDFSSDETTEILEKESERLGFTLFNLKSVTMHPSPNYLLILQIAQHGANFENAHMLIVESDVIVQKNTIQQLYDSITTLDKAGMIAAVTTDMNGKANFPYLYAQKYKQGILNTHKRLSFCCTLLTKSFLSSFNFDTLNPEKNWFEDYISTKSIELGFKNYLLTSLPVVHFDNGSRQLKILKFLQSLKH